MKCVICKQATTVAGKTTVSLERNGTTVVIKDVPAQVCPNCGESYVNEEVAARIMKSAEAAVQNGTEVEVRRYLAA
ncbi:MAG: type II toxin-antitoxin system MqsA family antitoxin [Ignavibacteriae bacterium]|nr:type II toxin-antitoxin system MqsA family antitoxin [Ignavibacteriota bacterium]